MLCAASVAAALAAGCGDGRPERLPVSGQVLIDGQPLPKAIVKFVPPDGRASGAVTDDNGRFSLTCYEPDDGVVPGTHRVAVRGVEQFNATTVRWFAPKKYADHRTSELEFEIVEPKEDLTINISWNGEEPFYEGPNPP